MLRKTDQYRNGYRNLITLAMPIIIGLQGGLREWLTQRHFRPQRKKYSSKIDIILIAYSYLCVNLKRYNNET